MNKQNNQIPVKLSKDEYVVRKYRLYEAKQNFKKSKIFMFVTNKRILICENKKTLLSKGNRFKEYDISTIVDVSTSIDDYIDLSKVIIALIIAMLLIPLGSVGIIIGLLLLIIMIVLAIVFKKSDGTLKLISNDRRIVISEVSTKRANIFLKQEQVKFKNVKRCKDFNTLQYELGAIIKDIQSGSVELVKEEEKKEINVNEIPDL